MRPLNLIMCKLVSDGFWTVPLLSHRKCAGRMPTSSFIKQTPVIQQLLPRATPTREIFLQVAYFESGELVFQKINLKLIPSLIESNFE